MTAVATCNNSVVTAISSVTASMACADVGRNQVVEPRHELKELDASTWQLRVWLPGVVRHHYTTGRQYTCVGILSAIGSGRLVHSQDTVII